ncbi:hypothetical protein DL93DRAFT_2225254 [Clavulina sp. PMI_390]|nr:hypothetical protein DL93DRAFT_2225254 [Clavulina sp. PMI_390]
MSSSRPAVIAETNLLQSPYPHLTPVYYRIFLFDHPLYSPHHAAQEDTALARFYLAEITPPYTTRKVINHLLKRESLDTGRPAVLFTNSTTSEPAALDELVTLNNRGAAPSGNPDEPLVLMLEGVETISSVVEWKASTTRIVMLLLDAITRAPITSLFYFVVLFPGLAVRWWALVS